MWKTKKWIPLVLGIKTLLYATGFNFNEEGGLIDGKTGRYPDFRTMGQPTAVNVDDCWWELWCRVGKEEGFQYRRETGERILALLDLSKLWGRDSWTPQELYLFIRAMPSAGEMENVVSYYREWFPHNNADTGDTRRQSLQINQIQHMPD